MNAGGEKRLVDVNVAEAAYQTLIEKNCLDLAGPPGEAGLEPLGREVFAQGLNSNAGIKQCNIRRMHVKHTTEFPLVREAEITAVIQNERRALVPQFITRGWNQRELAGHAEVDHDRRVVVEIEEEVLAAAANIMETPAADAGTNGVRTFGANDARKVPDPEIDNLPADDPVEQRLPDCLDFGKFWHTRWLRHGANAPGLERERTTLPERTPEARHDRRLHLLPHCTR